jgi:hypothetical protein
MLRHTISQQLPQCVVGDILTALIRVSWTPNIVLHVCLYNNIPQMVTGNTRIHILRSMHVHVSIDINQHTAQQGSCNYTCSCAAAVHRLVGAAQCIAALGIQYLYCTIVCSSLRVTRSEAHTAQLYLQ